MRTRRKNVEFNAVNQHAERSKGSSFMPALEPMTLGRVGTATANG
jgi:hypothetical protein